MPSNPITSDDLKAGARVVALGRALEEWRRRRPSDWYTPTAPGETAADGRVLGWTANQLAFHCSPHPVRALFPGNGWGKTTALGAEVNAWGLHTNRWQTTPAGPVLMLWFTKLYEQFELIRMQLQADIFGDDVVYADGGFRWPDGSRLYIGSADRPHDWRKWQGVPLDLGVFDEEPPVTLYREMMARRRVRKTRFVLGATATESGSWMESEIYQPWLDHHAAQGLDLEGAAKAQNHPDLFVWPRGGIHDNRAGDAEDIAWYDRQRWSGPKEREVRLHGGFQNWIGDPVFEAEPLERLRCRARELNASDPPPTVGMFELDPRYRPPASRTEPGPRPEHHGKPVTALTPEVLRGAQFILGPTDEKGSVTIFVPPTPGQTPVIGADFALGLEGRDLDVAVALDKSTRPVRQLAQAVGRWGETFDTVLYALAMYYGGAFILGEAQVGLPTLRRLLSAYHYGRLYYRRDETNRKRAVSDKLGHPRTYDDITMRTFRRGLNDGAFELRSELVIDQMGRLKYHNPTEIRSGERQDDFRLKLKLAGGGSPDLVMGACYAWFAVGEVEHYPAAEPLMPPGSMGEALGYGKLFEEEQRTTGISFVRRRPFKR